MEPGIKKIKVSQDNAIFMNAILTQERYTHKSQGKWHSS